MAGKPKSIPRGILKRMRKIWNAQAINNAEIVAAVASGATELFGPGYSETGVIPLFVPGYHEVEGDPVPAAVDYMTQVVQIRTAMINNKTFLNITTPSNAQNAAQVKDLTRQVNGIIKYLVGDMS
jgi:hypothetical protein